MTRIAMIGAGGVAQRHVGVLTSLADVQVVAVADPILAAADALAGTCGAKPFEDVEQALDAADADAAYVCVPPFAHGAAERAILDRGLPMFVEKPVSVDLDVAEEIGGLVADAGVVTGTGYHWRCLDTVARARTLLQDAPALLASGYWLDKRPPVPWWAHTDRSGGQVIEQLTHVLDLARVLLGEAVEVYAAGVRRDDHPRDGSGIEDRGDVDDATAATVRFASGAVATLAATSLLRAKHRAALHTFSPGLTLELSEEALLVQDGTSPDRRTPAEDPRLTVDREFVEAVRGERASTRAPYAEALRTHRLGCAVAESARTGKPVRLAEGQA
ncbi:MAG: Gfo/Idh/MocA family protein [Nocardioidaceae bacterium]